MKREVWKQIGTQIRAVHEIPQDQWERRLGNLSLRATHSHPPKVWQSLECGSRLDLRVLLNSDLLSPAQKAGLTRAAEEAANLPSDLCLIHRDLILRNVLVNEASHPTTGRIEITGIIDWDFVDLAPAWTEFVKQRVFHFHSGQEDYDALLEGYGHAPAPQAIVDGLAAIQWLAYLERTPADEYASWAPGAIDRLLGLTTTEASNP